jgi:hypothetical protein
MVETQNVIGKNCTVLSIAGLQAEFRDRIGRSAEHVIANHKRAKIGVVGLQDHLATSVHHTDSVLRFDRFSRRLDHLVRVLRDKTPDMDLVANVFHRLESYFAETRTEPRLSREIFNDKFTHLIEMVDHAQPDEVVEAIDTYRRYLEGVSSLDDDVPSSVLERLIDDLCDLQFTLDTRCEMMVIIPCVKKMVAYMNRQTTKDALMAEFYPQLSTVRFIRIETIYAMLARVRSVVPYDDRNSLRFRRFYRRVNRALETHKDPLELLWAARLYFDPQEGPQLNRSSLQTLFRRLVQLVNVGVNCYRGGCDNGNDNGNNSDDDEDAIRRTQLAGYINDLHVWIEGIETLSDDIGISHEAFDQFVEEVGLLCETTPLLSDLSWDLIALRVDSLKNLVRLDDDPSKRFVHETLTSAGLVVDSSADDWPLNLDALETMIGKTKSPYANVLGCLSEMYNNLNLAGEDCYPTVRYLRFTRRLRFFLEGFGRRAHHSSQERFLATMQLFFEPSITSDVPLDDLREQFRSLSAMVESRRNDDQTIRDKLDFIRTRVEKIDSVKGLTGAALDKYATELTCLDFNLAQGLPVEVITRQLAYMEPLLFASLDATLV